MNKQTTSSITIQNNGTSNTLRSLLIQSFEVNANSSFFGTISEKPIPDIKYKHPKKKLNTKEYQWNKYNDFYKEMNTFLNALFKEIPSILNEYSTIGIFSKNNYDSLITILGSMISSSYGIVNIYSSVNNNVLLSLCEEMKMKILFIDQHHINKLLELYNDNKDNFPITYLILFDNEKFNSSLIEQSEEYSQMCTHVTMINFSDLLKETKNETPDIIKSSFYLNKHKNKEFNMYCLSSVKYNIHNIKDQDIITTINDLNNFDCFKFNELDTYYMINPLSDITEVIFLLKIIFSGSKLALCSDFSNFFSEIEILHPTLVNAYPIVWKKLYTVIQNIINSLNEDKKAFLTTAIKVKMEKKEEHCIWDKILFDKIKNKFGSKIRHSFSAGNLLNQSITEFIELSLQAKMIQIYGNAETCGFISINMDNDGSIGKVLSSRQIELNKCEKIGIFTELPIEGYTKNKYIEDSCGEIIVNVNKKEIATGDYVIMVKRDKEVCFFFIEKIDSFLSINNNTKYISPLHFEILHNETFNGIVNNLFLSQDIVTQELIIVAHLDPKTKVTFDNPEKRNKKLLESILSEIKKKPQINLSKEELPNKVYIFVNNPLLFNSKMNINRQLLMKEVSKYFSNYNA